MALAVYVPSLATVKESKVQLVFGVDVVAQSLTVDATKVAGAVTASFVKTEIVWLVQFGVDTQHQHESKRE